MEKTKSGIKALETPPVVLLCAGGTGGHVFPAKALLLALEARGYCVHIATDIRGQKFLKDLPPERVHVVRSATFVGKNIGRFFKAGWALSYGFFQSLRLYRRLKPKLAAGFGGYPTFPPLIAAFLYGVPILLHEQNTVMGRANKVLAPLAKAIAYGFQKRDTQFVDKSFFTGNPIREKILEAAKIAYHPSLNEEPFHLLVFGGSQGTRFFTDVIPEAVALLPLEYRKRLQITHQADGDPNQLLERYKDCGVQVESANFFEDLPMKMAKAHYVIARSGASTVSEIAVIGRPALLVPYPYALDHDQAKNAEFLAERGGVKVIHQFSLDAPKIAALLQKAMDNPTLLKKQAEQMKDHARFNAVDRLADLAEQIMHKDRNSNNKEKSHENAA